MATPAAKAPLPICVDFRRTVRSNYLAECVLSALRSRPFLFFLLPFWLLRGAAYFAAQIYKYGRPNALLLPYNNEVISLLRAHRSVGHRLYLIGSLPALQADEIAAHLGIFHGYLGVNEVDSFFATPFLSADQFLPKAAPTPTGPFAQLLICLRAARLHQWVKNTLVFVPVLLAHQFTQPLKLAHAAIAFLSFSLCASSFYLFNDLFDVEADRVHTRKRHRPFASGELDIFVGVGIMVSLLAAAAFCAFNLPKASAQLILAYAIVNFLYSAFFKRFLFLDTVVLAFLYTLRILVGGSATHIEVSVWTLAFSLFFFLGLALLKRVIELVSTKESEFSASARRAYTSADLVSVNSFASSALFISVLITLLYINSPDVAKLYRHPQYLWLMSLPLLYWIGRLLTLANRGLLTDDPIVFAFRDSTSYLVGLAVVLCAFFAT